MARAYDPVTYRSRMSGERIQAHTIPVGHRQTVVDINGERISAIEGDYVIVYPYVEVVDKESFELEYERENDEPVQ